VLCAQYMLCGTLYVMRFRMRKRNVIALSMFALFYVALGAALTLNQERMIYHPFPQDFDACTELRDAERVTAGGTRMYMRSGERGLVVLYHGNAGSACDRAFYADMFVEDGYGYVLPEYTGYSNDSKTPTHEALKANVRDVVAYLQTVQSTSTLVVGESIGTGLASYHASLAAPDRLFLISPFTSLRALAQRKFWYYPARVMVDNAYDNVATLQTYAGQVMIMHGEDDAIVPHAQGAALFAALPERGDHMFITVQGAGHNDLFRSWDAFMAIDHFLGGALGREFFVHNPPQYR